MQVIEAFKTFNV